MHARVTILPFLAAFALFAAPLAAQKLSLSFNGDIADGANVLSAEFEQEANAKLARIEEEAGVSILLITTPGLEGVGTDQAASKIGKQMEEAGHIGKHWVVFLLSPADREFTAKITTRPELPPGTSIDELLDDDEKRAVLQELVDRWPPDVANRFKEGRWEDGLRLGLEAIVGHLDTLSPRGKTQPTPESEALTAS